MNELLENHRQEIAQKLMILAHMISAGQNKDCFIVGDYLVVLTVGPIKDIDTLENENPNPNQPNLPDLPGT